MNSKLFFFIIIFIPLLTFGQTKEVRQVSDFTGINASHAFQIELTKGEETSLTIEADEKIIRDVVSRVEGKTLNLFLDVQGIRNINTLKAYITLCELDYVKLSGACSLYSNDTFTPENFTAILSGASKVNLNIDCKNFNLRSSGAGNILLNANISENTQLELSGASKLQANLHTEKMHIQASGATVMQIEGSAPLLNLRISGAGKVRGAGFQVNNATIHSSGTSNIEVQVSDSLSVHSSGVSTIKYKGSPSTIQTNVSRTSTVRRIN